MFLCLLINGRNIGYPQIIKDFYTGSKTIYFFWHAKQASISMPGMMTPYPAVMSAFPKAECLNQSRQSDKLCILNGWSNIYYNSSDWEGKDLLDSVFSYFLIYREQPSLYTHMVYSCSLGSYLSPSFIPNSFLHPFLPSFIIFDDFSFFDPRPCGPQTDPKLKFPYGWWPWTSVPQAPVSWVLGFLCM